MEFRSVYYSLRLVAVLAIAVCALFYLWNVGGYSLLWVALLWGIGPALGMDNAVRRAAASGLEYPKPSRFKSIFGLCILWGIILAPAIIAIVLKQAITALCLAVSIFLVMAVTASLSSWLLGPRTSGRSHNAS